jgi:hypothetical protein
MLSVPIKKKVVSVEEIRVESIQLLKICALPGPSFLDSTPNFSYIREFIMLTKKIKRTGFFLALFYLAASFTPLYAQKAPANLQAALFTKLLAFYTNLGGDSFTIHVVGAPDVAEEFKKKIGSKVGKAQLDAVSEGDGPPSNGAKVIYVGKSVKAITDYSQANKVLTITGEPKFVNDGVTLGVAIEGGKPKILLNLSATKAEDVNWNPAILKVASTID